jgi:hypothetical protein
MKRFSERKGFKKARDTLQVDSIDSELRNRLWNVLDFHYWKGMIPYSNAIIGDDKVFFNKLWHYYFKKPVDNLKFVWYNDLTKVREYFFNCEWYEVYDVLEFVASTYPDVERNNRFMKTCNDVLEAELSAYRFIGGKIIEITSKEEMSEIEEALTSPYKTVNTHIENALRLISDRKNPDYRNSIKESISAVEATCNLLAGKKITLGQCLKEIKEKVGLHGALEKAFSSLYGYTSEAEGIRHALLDEPTLSFEDAKFMLVSCSAFVNYLKSKASKAGLKMH